MMISTDRFDEWLAQFFCAGFDLSLLTDFAEYSREILAVARNVKEEKYSPLTTDMIEMTVNGAHGYSVVKMDPIYAHRLLRLPEVLLAVKNEIERLRERDKEAEERRQKDALDSLFAIIEAQQQEIEELEDENEEAQRAEDDAFQRGFFAGSGGKMPIF